MDYHNYTNYNNPPPSSKNIAPIIIFTVFLISLFAGGFYLTQKRTQRTPQQGEEEISISDEEIAKDTLSNFFLYLEREEFEKAASLFSPETWEVLDSFSPEEEREDKAKVLKNYCEIVGTCLRAEILKAEKLSDDEYKLTVQFIQENGEAFVLEPCCGATEETMPSQSEFEYRVKRVNGEFKVVTEPVYRP